MDARSVGLRLVELARANQDAKAVEEQYDENIVSIEIMGGADNEPQLARVSTQFAKNTHGVKALRQSTASMSKDHSQAMAMIILSYVIKWMSPWNFSAAR